MQVYFTVNVRLKFRNSIWCSLNRMCLLNGVHLVQFSLLVAYVSVNSKTTHAPPRQTPGHLTFLKKFWSNSPLCCQFRRSNVPPVRASKRVKSPTLQACEENCGNKFCKIFSHNEFLVQLVFAPHFKQRHIPR